MRQPWDWSQRFPVIAAGGEFGTSRLTKSEPSLRDSCKPEVLRCAQHGQDLLPPKMWWVRVACVSRGRKNGEQG